MLSVRTCVIALLVGVVFGVLIGTHVTSGSRWSEKLVGLSEQSVITTLGYPDFRAIDVSGIDQWVEFHTLGINVLSIYFDASHVAKRTEKEFVFGFGYEKQEMDYRKKLAD